MINSKDKYVRADRLIAEIEREVESSSKKIKSGKSDEKSTFCRGEITALYTIKSIISSLQQEQPEVDLENYLENYFKGWHIEEEIGLTKPDGWSCIVADIKEIARHFYELGRAGK